MESLILIGIVVGVISWIYKAGKHEGSRKGYNVGRHRGRFRR